MAIGQSYPGPARSTLVRALRFGPWVLMGTARGREKGGALSRFEVLTESLRTASGIAAGLAGEVTGLAGQFGSGPAAGADPSGDTATALDSFDRRWAVGVADLGSSVGDLGASVSAAAALYEHTDRATMPAGPG